ncbi:hypothetical protein LOS78_18070 [Paracoccus sp. MA]|uniref:hypothetical protein n=1 Tax=Paracoccus sp. MA TaxID=2895796 RepID=UPI001E5FBCA8|nr:hypothetical protein [Paracoccus sp. MA]UFM65536.1 hypothetical protein LOS78_18070 [Paracoccus sp. MA]
MRPFLIAFLVSFSLPSFANDGAAPVLGALTAEDIQDARQRLLDLRGPDAALLDAACCKMCSKGKACGDSCISRDKQCRKGVGCTCDG